MKEIKQQIIKRAEDRLKCTYSADVRIRILTDMKEELEVLKKAEAVFSNIENKGKLIAM